MTKKVIAIVSVLKPVDDARNFEKIATSIGNTNKYDINIIGFSAKKLPDVENISFYPAFRFKRLSIKRLGAPVTIIKILLKLKPELIIVTCAELLSVICVYKILFGGKIVYDIQENYYRNIRYTNTFPLPIRIWLAWLVRLTESICSPLIDQFILAEKVYADQLKFIGRRYQVIENKAIIPSNLQTEKPNHDGLTLLYSGTIARHYGIFEAIDFITKLRSIDNQASLRIVGFTADKRVLDCVKQLIIDKSFIELVTDNQPLPHQSILQEMINADFCLLPYLPNKSSEGRIPTKLYECLAMRKPVIIQQNPVYDKMISVNDAGIIHDFTLNEIKDNLLSKDEFYTMVGEEDYTWRLEHQKLIRCINELFTQT